MKFNYMFVLACIGKCELLRRSPCLGKHSRRMQYRISMYYLLTEVTQYFGKEMFEITGVLGFGSSFKPDLPTNAWKQYDLREALFECRSKSLCCRLFSISMWEWNVHRVHMQI